MATVNPIGVVRSARTDTRDDNWGDVESVIELRADLPAESLAGLEDFSHAEILFVFDRIDEQSVVTGTRHPRDNPAWPKVGIFAQRASRRPNRRSSGAKAGSSASEASTPPTGHRSSTSSRSWPSFFLANRYGSRRGRKS
jgi:hypothetical protein